MQSKELLLIANQQCAMMVVPMLEDLRTASLISPTPNGGNHAHWVLGHLVLSEGQFRSTMDGSPNPYEELRPLFGAKSTPSPNVEGYPTYDELLSRLKAAHELTLAWVGGMTEEDLDQRSVGAPPGFEMFFGTWRQVLLMRAMHWMNHRGQLADCRRAAGRPALLA